MEENTNDGPKEVKATVICQIELWKTLASRRQSFDSMVWQTAGFALTAQSFLYVIALNGSNQPWARIVAFGLSICCGLATIQLMSKHRFHEVRASKALAEIEKKNKWQPLHEQPDSSGGCFWQKWSSVTVWYLLQWAFILVSFTLIILTLTCGDELLSSPRVPSENLWPAGSGNTL